MFPLHVNIAGPIILKVEKCLGLHGGLQEVPAPASLDVNIVQQ